MSTNEVRLTRRQLHEQVWSTPMMRLARQYGLSDVGLAKICKKFDIPRPGLGYWVQVKYGVAIGPDELPNPDVNPEIVLRAHQPPTTSSAESGGFTNIFARALETEAYLPRIVVTETQSIHPWGTTSLEVLHKAKSDECGRCLPENREALHIRVGPKSLLRAHRLMNRLLIELESRGCEVRPVRGGTDATYIRICGEFVAISIAEMLSVKAVLHSKTVRSGYYETPPLPPWPAEQSVKLTGRLILSLHPTVYLREEGLRCRWRDTDHQCLENCLNDIIVGIIRIATAQREDHANPSFALFSVTHC